MFSKPSFAFARFGLIGLLLASPFSSNAAPVAVMVTLPDSTKPVDAAPATGTATHAKPYISRQTLTAAETNAPLEFEVALKMRNFADLQARVNRGEHISLQEMTDKYEPSAADYQSVVNWLKGEGLTVTRQDPHHLAVFVRGNVGQIARSLRVTFARVTSEGKEYTSAVTAPSVPANLSPLLIGINGLQPHIRAHKHLIKQQVQPDGSAGSAPYFPSQIAQAYSATGLYNNSITGTGQTIAIVIDTFPAKNDLTAFWQAAGVSQSINNISFIQVITGTLPAPSGEETLDTEWSSSIAPGCHVRVYATVDLGVSDLDQAYEQVLTDATTQPQLGIHQMSMSYGEGETETSQTQVDTDDQYFSELAAAGVTMFASSGDGGSTPGNNSTNDQTGQLQVEAPADDPNVTGVGGTSLQLDSNNNESSEAVWNSSDETLGSFKGATGGGISEYFNRPAWQKGAGVPTGSFRLVPDVACSADPAYSAYLYINGAPSNGGIGGTSWASPTWAGFCALINQARANAGLSPIGSLGSFGSLIYPLIGTSNFRDIITGSNALYGSGSTNYTAGVGYDMCTGIGVPLVQTLSQTLVGISAQPQVQIASAFQDIVPGQSATISVTSTVSPLSYQWQRMPIGTTSWSNLSDNGTYSGSATASLTIIGAGTAMSGDQFQCVVTFAGPSTVTSPSSALVVDDPLIISPLAGAVGVGALKNGSGTSANFNIPSGIAIDAAGNLYIADFSNNAIREVTTAGVVTTPYGNINGTSGSANGNGNSATFNTPNSIAFDKVNNVFYVADLGNNLIRKINPAANPQVTTFAGAGGTLFNTPESVAVDSSGNVYVADTNNDVIREITPSGTVSIIAGQVGTAGFTNGAATTTALFNQPSGVIVDSSGNVYVADYGNNVVRVISSGVVSTLAGQVGIAGYVDGPSGKALFNAPVGLALDSVGNLYVADCAIPEVDSIAAGNDLIRKISTVGVVSTLAGQAGVEGSANGTGTGAQFYSVQAVAFNPALNTFYIADTFNQTIRSGTVFPTPTLTLTATQPNALVFGPMPGQFTVTRTGPTNFGLTVDFSTAGTAISGTDYTTPLTPLPGAVTIPSGASSATITVNPISNPSAVSTPTLQLNLTGDNGYTIGSPGTATVTISELTLFQSWQTNEFGSNATNASIAGPLADPNHNGVPNFLEYAFNSNPLQGGTEPLPVFSIVPDGSGNNYVALTFTELDSTIDPNITYTVQVTSDLSQQTDQWHSGPGYTSTVSQTDNGTTTEITVRDTTPITSTAKRFIRVQVGGN